MQYPGLALPSSFDTREKVGFFQVYSQLDNGTVGARELGYSS
jgi:hypothetical protein